MSVAVPRPLNVNTSMNPNIASRPSGSGSSGGVSSSRAGAGPSNGKIAIPSRPNMNSRTVSSVSTATVASTSVSVAPLASGPGKDTSSSAGKVFAKPSKEWVLPERAKPGRKVCAEEPDNKRQSQNRLSQRAHRARRTDYITTLEERLRQYEADEIHSNVRLQEVARALKTDNERMKNELLGVKGKMNEMLAERETWEMERKGLEEMCGSLMSEVERLRSRAGDEAGGGLKLDPTRVTTTVRQPCSSRLPHAHVSPPSQVEKRTGPTVACPICPDPDPDCPCQQPAKQTDTLPQPRVTETPLSTSVDPITAPAPHQPDCGFCQTPAECLCRIINENPTPPKTVQPLTGPKGKCDVCSSLTICLCEDGDDTPPPPISSSSVKSVALPRATAAVPLSLRRNVLPNSANGDNGAIKRPLWRLDNVVKKGEAVCTGDPENCDACKNDDFGREFCGHLFDQNGTSGQVKPCNSCPGNCMSIQSLLSPKPGADLNNGVVISPPTPPTVPQGQTREEQEETMRCDEAWKQLKAHPNAKFASLALLADVVAGRTKCTGPTIELSPAPASAPSPIPAHLSSPLARNSSIGVGVGVGIGVGHHHHHAHHTTENPTPGSRSPLVPKSSRANIKPPSTGAVSGTKRRVAVETSAVRDALRMLDSTPSRSASEVIQVKTEPLDLDEVNARASKRIRLE